MPDQARPVRLVDAELGDGALDGGLGVGLLDPAKILPFARIRVMRQRATRLRLLLAAEYRRGSLSRPWEDWHGSPSMSAFVRKRPDRAVRTDFG